MGLLSSMPPGCDEFFDRLKVLAVGDIRAKWPRAVRLRLDFRDVLWSLMRFRSQLRVRPRSEGRCGRFSMNHLGNPQAPIATSYVDAPKNLDGAETKHAGALTIMAKFLTSGKLPRYLTYVASQFARRRRIRHTAEKLPTKYLESKTR